jgi:hypothetical protein
MNVMELIPISLNQKLIVVVIAIPKPSDNMERSRSFNFILRNESKIIPGKKNCNKSDRVNIVYDQIFISHHFQTFEDRNQLFPFFLLVDSLLKGKKIP